MLQLVALQVVGEQAVAVGRHPDNIARVVHDVVALLVDVIDLLGGHQAEALDLSRLGIDIPHYARAVVYPVVATVVCLHLTLRNRQVVVAAQLMRVEVELVASRAREDDPMVLQVHGAVEVDARAAIAQRTDRLHLIALALAGNLAIPGEEVELVAVCQDAGGVVVVDDRLRLIPLDTNDAFVRANPDAVSIVLKDIGHAIRGEAAEPLFVDDGVESAILVGHLAATVAFVVEPHVPRVVGDAVAVMLLMFAAAREIDKAIPLQVVAADQVGRGEDPQKAVRILLQTPDAVVRERDFVATLGTIRHERIAVVTAQSAHRAHPDKAFAVLIDVADGVVGNSVVGGHMRSLHLDRGEGV